MRLTALDRLQRKLVYNKDNCWIWIGSQAGEGYGKIRAFGKIYLTHRLSYILHKGKIKKGLEIDHLCRNRLCSNPEHLEAVTKQVNVSRSNVGLKNKSKTECPHGHLYSKENTRYYGKKRLCRECGRIDVRRRRYTA